MKYSSYGDTDFVTGLRAIAALMVVVVHTAAFEDVTLLPDGLSSIGKYGVQMFFVIAGFTVAANLKSGMSLKSFFIRRTYRLMPPYIVAMLLYIAAFTMLSINLSSETVDRESWLWFFDFLLHLSFLNIFFEAYTGSIIGVEWTLSVEYFSYFLLFFLIRYLRVFEYHWLIVFLLTLAISMGSKSVIELFLGWNTAHVFPLTYLVYFVTGVLAFKYRLKESRFDLEAISIFFFVLACVSNEGRSGALIGIATAFVLISARSSSGFLGPILSRRLMLFIGTLSYSIYLYHILVREVIVNQIFYSYEELSSYVFFILVTIGTVLLSLITHRYIDLPAAELGRKLGRIA